MDEVKKFVFEMFNRLLSENLHLKTPDYLNDRNWSYWMRGMCMRTFNEMIEGKPGKPVPNTTGRRNFDRVWARFECQRQGPAKTPTFRL